MLQCPVISSTVKWCLPFTIDPILDAPIDSWELMSVVKSLKIGKAPGQDGVSYEFFKYAPTNFLNEILCIFNKIFLHECMPTSFRSSILLPLFKKGDPTLPSNYRGRSLTNCICKIFASLILNRLIFWVDHNNILNEFQAGFKVKSAYWGLGHVRFTSNLIFWLICHP